MKVCSGASCNDLTNVMEEAMRILSEREDSVYNPKKQAFMILRDSVPHRIREKVLSAKNVSIQDLSKKGAVDIVLSGPTIETDDVEILSRGKVCNHIFGDIMSILTYNTTQNKPSYFVLRPSMEAEGIIKFYVVVVLKKERCECFARRSVSENIGISDFKPVLSEVCYYLCSRSADHKIVVAGNEISENFLGAVEVIEVDVRSMSNEVVKCSKVAFDGWNDVCAVGLLTSLFTLLENSNVENALVNRGWTTVYSSFRAPLDSSKLFTLVEHGAEPVVNSSVKLFMKSIGFHNVPLEVTDFLTEGVDVLNFASLEEIPSHMISGTKRARLLSRMRGAVNTMSNIERLHSVLYEKRKEFVENVTDDKCINDKARLVHSRTIDLDNKEDLEELKKMLDLKNVQWICTNEKAQKSFLQFPMIANDGKNNSFEECSARMKKSVGMWKVKRFIRPYLFPVLTTSVNKTHKGIIRCIAIIQYKNGEEGASMYFMEESPSIILSDAAWKEAPTTDAFMQDPSFAPGGKSLDAEEAFDSIYNNGYFKTNIKPQLEHILEVALSSIKSMYAKYELCDNNNSVYFKGCFQSICLDIECDVTNEIVPNGTPVPKCFLTAVNLFPFSYNLAQHMNVSSRVFSVLKTIFNANKLQENISLDYITKLKALANAFDKPDMIYADTLHMNSIRKPETLDLLPVEQSDKPDADASDSTVTHSSTSVVSLPSESSLANTANNLVGQLSSASNLTENTATIMETPPVSKQMLSPDTSTMIEGPPTPDQMLPMQNNVSDNIASIFPGLEVPPSILPGTLASPMDAKSDPYATSVEQVPDANASMRSVDSLVQPNTSTVRQADSTISTTEPTLQTTAAEAGQTQVQGNSTTSTIEGTLPQDSSISSVEPTIQSYTPSNDVEPVVAPDASMNIALTMPNTSVSSFESQVIQPGAPSDVVPMMPSASVSNIPPTMPDASISSIEPSLQADASISSIEPSLQADASVNNTVATFPDTSARQTAQTLSSEFVTEIQPALEANLSVSNVGPTDASRSAVASSFLQ